MYQYQPTTPEIDAVWWVVLAAVGIAVGLMIIIAIFRHFLRIATPNTALVFSGPSYTQPDGTKRGFMVLQNGRRKLQIPILEKVDV